MEIFAEFGEHLHILDRGAHPGAIDPGDERDVLAPGQGTMKRAAKAERKRYAGVTPDDAAIGHLGPGKQSDQGRLARAVHTEDSEIVAGFKSDVGIVEHGFSPAAGAIDFGYPVERDHSGS